MSTGGFIRLTFSGSKTPATSYSHAFATPRHATPSRGCGPPALQQALQRGADSQARRTPRPPRAPRPPLARGKQSSPREVCLRPPRWGSGGRQGNLQGRRAPRGQNLLRGQRAVSPRATRSPDSFPPVPCPAAGRPAPPPHTRHAHPGAPDPAPAPLSITPAGPPQSWFQRRGGRGRPRKGSRSPPPPPPRERPGGSRSASPSPGFENGGVRLPGAKSESLPWRKPGRRRGRQARGSEVTFGRSRRRQRRGQRRASRGRRRSQRRRLPQCPPPHCFPSKRIPAKPSPGTRKFPARHLLPPLWKRPRPQGGRPGTPPPRGRPARLTGRRRTPPPRPRPPPSWRLLPGGPGRPAFPPPGARPALRGRGGNAGAEAGARAPKGEGGTGDPGGAAGTDGGYAGSAARTGEGGAGGRSTAVSPRAGSPRPACLGSRCARHCLAAAPLQ